MSYDFKSKPWIDAAIYSGYNPKVEALFSTMHPGVERHADVYKTAFTKFEVAYTAHKRALQFSSDEFVKLVDKNIVDLMKPDTDSAAQKCVVEKLNNIAQNKLQKESTYSLIHLFFSKVGQLIKGHGFKTSGTWITEIANRIQPKEKLVSSVQPKKLSAIEHSVKQSFATASQWNPMQLQKADFEVLNQLQQEEFLEVSAPYFSGSIPSSIANVYSSYYNGLDQEKKAWLLQAILKSKDWPIQLVKLGVKHILAEQVSWEAVGITPEMLQKLKDHPQIFYDAQVKFKHIRLFDSAAMKLIAAVVTDYLNNNDFSSLHDFLRSAGGAFTVSSLINHPDLMTQEEVDLLRESVRRR